MVTQSYNPVTGKWKDNSTPQNNPTGATGITSNPSPTNTAIVTPSTWNGVYNPTTGQYISPSGQIQSMPQAPPGAQIIGAPQSQTTYIGGGTISTGGGHITFPSLTLQQQQQFIAPLLKNIGGEIGVYSQSGDLIGVQSKYLNKTIPIDTYNQIIKSIPTSGYINPITKEFSETSKPYYLKAYLNPQTNQVFESNEELNTYLKKNKIPTSEGKITTPEQLREVLTQPTYFGYKELQKLPTKIPFLQKVREYPGKVISGLKSPGEMDIYGNIYGSASGLYVGIPRQEGESLGKWYLNQIKDMKTTQEAFNIALSLTGAKLLPTSPSWAIALVSNTNNFDKLISPSASNETKLASLGEIALTLGTSVLEGLAFGTVAKYSEEAITTLGYKTLANILRKGGPQANILFKNIAGLSLIGAGKATKFAIETYFKSGLISSGITALEATKQKDYYKASLSGSELVGGLIGYPIGEKIGSKLFTASAFIPGVSIFGKPEIPSIKTTPSAILSEMITKKDAELYGYRRGPIEIGMKYEPRFDKYVKDYLKDPTKQVFFRIEETKGTKGQEIQPVLSVPEFVQAPTYTEMFKANLEVSQKASNFGKIMEALAKTPVLTDVISLARFKNEFSGSEELRQRIIREQATTGELSKKTQKDLLKVESRISDKMRTQKFQEEQEMAFRKQITIGQEKGTDFGFTRNAQGKIIPVIYEKGTIKPRTSFWESTKNIVEQDAKFIQRQFEMWKTFGMEYILPKEHGPKHAMSVAKNIRLIVNSHPEYHEYFIKEYGSVEKAIKELQLGAKFHDIGKTRESSREFGTDHAIKFFNVWKEGLLPNEAQLITSKVAKAIKTHEELDPRTLRQRLNKELENVNEQIKKLQTQGKDPSFFERLIMRKNAITISLAETQYLYPIKEKFGLITPEQKILATADRLDLVRYNLIVDSTRLPIKDVIKKLPEIQRKEIERINKFGDKRTIEEIDRQQEMIDKKIGIMNIKEPEVQKQVFQLPSSKLFEQVKGKEEKGITWEEMSSTGRDFIRDVTMQGAIHEVDMFELTQGKLTPSQRKILIEGRYEKSLKEYKDSLKQQNKIENTIIKSEKQIIPEKTIKINDKLQKEDRILQDKIYQETSYPKLAKSYIISPYTIQEQYSIGYPKLDKYGNVIYPSKYKEIQYPKEVKYPTSYKETSYPSTYKKITTYPTPYKETSYPSKYITKSPPYGPPKLPPIKEIPIKQFSLPIEGKKIKEKSLGEGYNVYGKALKSNKFFKINNYPLTKSRAKDVGSYYVSQTLARTFRIEKTKSSAQPDYQFMSIPEGYFNMKIGTLREYKIRQRTTIETPEQFIQKGVFALSSEAEKKSIQAFRKEASQILR